MQENYSRFSDWFKRKKPEQRPPLPAAEQPAAPMQPETEKPEDQTPSDVEPVVRSGIEGVVTDQKLLSWYYKKFQNLDTQPVATDKFMDKSKNEYNAAWLARELTQNFVDENEQHPFTLDGVDIHSQTIDEKSGMVRFTIRGDWAFEDPTGLTSLHSAKTKKRKTAGGNGIGLKQVALRYLRDFGVQKFEIQGENWAVNYRLAHKDAINKELQDSRHGERVRHDWLLADIQHSDNKGQNSYIIETNNQEIIRALQELPNLGVSETNAFLQNLDFKNEKGALKFLPVTKDIKDAQGRLFINGQVMNFKNKGESGTDYWRGPEFATIQLNDVDYRMSIDRPPLNAFDLNSYSDQLIQSMSEDEMISQLQKSEHLWSTIPDAGYGSDRKGCFVVIEAMVSKLWLSSKYNKSSFASHFSGKNYLCWDYGVKENQIHDLEKQGFIICPPYFEKIGMPKASSKLDSLEVASNEKPMSPQYKLEKIAEEYGLTVAHEKMEFGDPEKFLNSVKEKLADHTLRIETRENRSNAFRVYLDLELPKELLFHQLSTPKTEEQKLLHYLRGAIFTGLEDRIFQKAFMSNGKYITTFGTQYDPVTEENNLLARNVKCSSDQGFFIEFELPQELADAFQASLIRDSLRKEAGPAAAPQTQEPKITEQKQKEEAIKEMSKPGGSKITAPKEVDVKVVKSIPKPDVSPEISETKKELEAVPVRQPEPAALPEKEQKIILKHMQLSEEEQSRLQELEQKIPEITEAITSLESLISTQTARKRKTDVPDKYVRWRNSPDFYGQASQEAQYLTGRHLLEIVAEHNKADIAIALSDREKSEAEQKMARLNATLKELANRFAPPEDEIDDFEIVLAPTEQQLAKLGILRAYAHLTTEVALPNDVFIYQGTGSKGVNIAQKAIGLHESLLSTDFKETLGTYTHEIAHNASMDHDVKFMHTMQALFGTMNERLTQISEKLLNAEKLDDKELMILELKRKWNKTT